MIKTSGVQANSMSTYKGIKLYQLFTKRFDSNNNVLRFPAFDLVRRTYEKEVERIVEYFNTRVYAVRSDHFLCKLLNTAVIPISYTVERYMEVAYTRGPYVAKSYKLTSAIDDGKIHHGIFYGEGCREIILYDDEYFNPYWALANWKTLEPITVLEHPVSDLELLLPNGLENSTAKGLCSISINLPMLLIMYRGFLEEQSTRFHSASTDAKLGVAHFVHMYVLPSMLRSHVDVVILNRLKNLFYGSPMSDNLKKHPFYVINQSRTIDSVLQDCMKHIFGRGLYYFSTLKSIPTIFKEDAQELLMMPDIARTRQVWWALIVTRLNTMKFLIDVGQEKGMRANASLINRLKIELTRLDRENYLEKMLGEEISYEVNETTQEILKL